MRTHSVKTLHRRDINDDVQRLVCRRARELAGRHGFSSDEETDLAQQLFLDYWRRLAHYDRSKASPRTFGQRLIRNHAASLIAGKKAQCRDYRLCLSLEQLEARGLQIAGALPLDTLALMRRSAIGRTVSTLRPRQQKIALLLLEGETKTGVARKLGISRVQIDRELKQMRETFAAAGLRP